MVHAQKKGAAGEREAAKWLKSRFNLEIEPKRNLEQVRSGGFDLEGFPPFALEIKRCETLQLRDWWVQATNSCTRQYCIPVVMYRQNKKPWRFLISAKTLGLKNGYVMLEEREFIMWVQGVLNSLSKA